MRRTHLPPYSAAIQAGVGSIMVSYSSWNGQKMHGQKHLITDVLKGELVAEGRVPLARIDDAVRRILRVKFAMGLFDQIPVDPALTADIGSASHRSVARECVRQSLVLLKNDRAALPLSKDLKRICVLGPAADDLGMQCGGWTLGWQGETSNAIQGGTTLLQAILQTVGSNTVVGFSPDGTDIEGADAVIVVVGEKPYAEWHGDRQDLPLAAADRALIKTAKRQGAPVISVLLCGCPLILGDALEASDAFLTAWLPGTEGQGVADVLFGDYQPTGKLPRPWPSEMSGMFVQTSGASPALFPYGFGLTCQGPGVFRVGGL